MTARRILATLALAALVSVTAGPFWRHGADAQEALPALSCTDFPYAGIWVADRPDIGDLARITVEMDCIDDRLRALRIKAETRCHPRNCTFGWADTINARGTNEIRAIFHTFSATRTLAITVAGNRMLVDMENVYNQPGRSTDLATALLIRRD
ncbi:MAG: hypothetical protein KDI98_07080 [Hyphomicrobiaceae bacterium]|nr:hypothetical protein [Hyphomicrobiaceae bacterium]